jgi:energy-coupling factor transporter transmembrane protein EcfT
MMDFLASIEQSGFCTWVRESNSLLAYPSVLFLHTVGIGFVAGISMMIDLRLLGFAPEVPLSGLRKALPYMWGGFWLNLATGLILFGLDATTKSISPVFYTKLIFIGIALGICRSQRGLFEDGKALASNARTLAFVSLVCWMGAVTAGRLLAYVGPGVVSSGT